MPLNLIRYLREISTQTYVYLAVFWLILTTTLSLLSKSSISSLNFFDIVGIDKIGHLGFYTIFAFLWCMAMRQKDIFNYSVLLFSITFGLLMEICQATLTVGRAFEWYDMLANSIGAILGYYIFLRFFK